MAYHWPADTVFHELTLEVDDRTCWQCQHLRTVCLDRTRPILSDVEVAIRAEDQTAGIPREWFRERDGCPQTRRQSKEAQRRSPARR